MNWTEIVNGLFGAGGLVVVVLKLIEIYSNRGKSKAETVVLKSEAGENITEAASVAVTALLQSLDFMQKERAEYLPRLKSLEESHRDISKQREERDRRFGEIQAQLEEQNEQNEALQAKLAALQAQIDKDTRETEALRKQVAELKDKYDKQLRINARLVKWFEDKGEPLPDLNGDLGDSIKGFKWNE